jgi:hypothetical protein
MKAKITRVVSVEAECQMCNEPLTDKNGSFMIEVQNYAQGQTIRCQCGKDNQLPAWVFK